MAAFVVSEKLPSDTLNAPSEQLVLTQSKIHVSRQNLKSLAFILFLVFGIWRYAYPGCEYHRITECATPLAVDPVDFDWMELLPSETLSWTSCYDTFQCARLEVPLDYTKPHAEKAAIALLKLPSKYPVGHEKWRGPILYNPGGPGGSGVDLVLGRGENFSRIIGDDYDHIGFDPRGIGRTTPALDIFPNQGERKLWNIQAPPPINSTVDAIAKLHGYADILGELAVERGLQVSQHVSTATVARDMLQITKAHGRDKLLYWGLSYGTVLGITYASMFPGNIERLIVDGVVDTNNYYAAAWSNNLMDTDNNLKAIIKECAASSACPLHESTAEAVQARLDAILNKLKTNPIPVVNGSNYGIADWKLAHNAIFQSLYKPETQFPPLAEALVDAEKGDGRALFRVTQKDDSLFRCNCSPLPSLPRIMETTAAIACGDGDPVNVDVQELDREYAEMAKLSPFTDVWTLHGLCSGWKIRASERFTGPFIGNTSFPILLIGNTADPVTPLWAAKKMSVGFKDSVVLTQNTPGHCSLAATSLCTTKYIREYFREGKLPPAGTTCEVDSHIFPPNDDDMTTLERKLQTLSKEDGELLMAAKDLSQRFEVPMLGLPF